MGDVYTFAWTGAALFAGSLLHFAWRFFGPFGTPAPDGTSMASAIAIDFALFTVFALHHSVLARSGVKAALIRHIPPAIERATYVWVASLLFIGVCAAWQPVPGLLWHITGPAAWGLGALSLVGAWLTLHSAVILDVFELAGTRPFMRPRPGAAEFTAQGPYGLVRHPIYLAWLFLVWTPTSMTGTRLVFAAISTCYLIVAIPFEERTLRASAGPSYATYAARVRWRMVPFLY